MTHICIRRRVRQHPVHIFSLAVCLASFSSVAHADEGAGVRFENSELSGQSGPLPEISRKRHSRTNSGISEEELQWAQSAWAYFSGGAKHIARDEVVFTEQPTKPVASNEAQPQTKVAMPMPGALVPARSDSVVATMWSAGDQIAAALIAERLGLIDARELDRRFSALLGFLNTMPLAFGQMPNRYYDSVTGAMLGSDFQPGTAGWSAVDAGRLLLWLRIAALQHPQFEGYIRNAVRRWNVCSVVSESGLLQSAVQEDGAQRLSDETARGYDVYAVQGFRAWGLDTPSPVSTKTSAELSIFGAAFPLYEDRNARAPVLTTVPAYIGMELGLDVVGSEVSAGRDAKELLDTLHDVQARRFAATGVLTARADYRRSTEPFTVIDSVISNGYPWSTGDVAGSAHPRLALVSTRAVFGLWAFYESEYVEALRRSIVQLYDPALGWFEGRSETTGGYEITRSSSTNAFVLEAIAFRNFGSLFPNAAWPDQLAPPITDCRLPFSATSTEE
jgi:hypothetical protein